MGDRTLATRVVLLIGVVVGAVVGIGGVFVGSGGAAPVVEKGSVTCTFSGSIAYTPHLQKNGNGSSTSSVKVNHPLCKTATGTPLAALFQAPVVSSNVVRPYTVACSTTNQPGVTTCFDFQTLATEHNTMEYLTVDDPKLFLQKGLQGSRPTQDCTAGDRDGVYIAVVIDWNGISVNQKIPKTKIAPSTVIFGGAQPDWSSGRLTYHLPVPGSGAGRGSVQASGSFAGSNHGAGSSVTLKTSLSKAQYVTACATKAGFSGMNFTGTMTLQSTTTPPSTTTTIRPTGPVG